MERWTWDSGDLNLIETLAKRDDLYDIFRAAVERRARQVRTGDRVRFPDRRGTVWEGVVVQRNRKTVQVACDRPSVWRVRVSPALLEVVK